MTLLLTGIALGVLFNPATGPDTRRWLRDKISGRKSRSSTSRTGRRAPPPSRARTPSTSRMARKNPGYPHGPLSVLLGLRPRCRRPRLRLDADRPAAGGTPRFPGKLPGRAGDRARRHRRRPPRRGVWPGGTTRNLAGRHEPPRDSISRACSCRSGARVGAEIVESGGRSAIAEATIQDDSGFLLAHARAECVQVRPEYFLSTPQGKARGTDWLPPRRA